MLFGFICFVAGFYVGLIVVSLMMINRGESYD